MSDNPTVSDTNQDQQKIPQNHPNPNLEHQAAPQQATQLPPTPTQLPQNPVQAKEVGVPQKPQMPGMNSEHSPAETSNNNLHKPKKKHSGIMSAIKLTAGALAIAFFINSFIFQSYQVFGSSMEQTLSEGDRLIISKVSKSWHSVFGGKYVPNRGEIIVFNSPAARELQLIKRVIGVPGDTVVVENGVITIYNDENPQGFSPDEDWEDSLPPLSERTGNARYEVGEGQVFVSGDNRINGGSLDSRNDLGLVPVENITGNLVLRIYPLSEAAFY